MTLDILFVAWNRLAFTKFSFQMLRENTPWERVNRLVIHDDGSEDGTYDWLVRSVRRFPVPVEVRQEQLRSPAAVMNRYVASSEVEWFAKIDNDIVVPPGWLEALSGIVEREHVDLLGMEAGRMPQTADWDGVYRFEEGSHMGGVGLIRVEALRSRPRMVEDAGRFGWTEWQHEYGRVRGNGPLMIGWANPDPCPVQLDRVPFEPWRSLSARYTEMGWQRGWSPYHEKADYWSWWPDVAFLESRR